MLTASHSAVAHALVRPLFHTCVRVGSVPTSGLLGRRISVFRERDSPRWFSVCCGVSLRPQWEGELGLGLLIGSLILWRMWLTLIQFV